MSRIDCVVPQGSFLGPRLYAIMTSDLPECSNTGKIEIFANDMDLICNLQKMLDDIYLWCRENSLSYHPEKREITIIHKKQFTGPLQRVRLNEKQIQFVDKFECLGITTDTDLKWELQISL